MSILKQFLSNNSHWQVNKHFARMYGLETAVLITDLIDKWGFFGYSEWFYNTAENIQENTTLTYHKQKRCLDVLQKHGFIETSLRGTPAKLHFRIIENKILNSFNSSIQKTLKLDLEILNTNKNKDIKNKDENKDSSASGVLDFNSKIFTKWTKEDLKASIMEARKKRAENEAQPNFSKELLNEFFQYWTAPHKSGKMFFAVQDKWSTLQRLISWQSRANNSNK